MDPEGSPCELSNPWHLEVLFGPIMTRETQDEILEKVMMHCPIGGYWPHSLPSVSDWILSETVNLFCWIMLKCFLARREEDQQNRDMH